MKLRASMAFRTDVGPVREQNEDSVGVLTKKESAPGVDGVYVVADGLGGHEGGEVASAAAVEFVLEEYRTATPADTRAESLEASLGQLMRVANQRVYDMGLERVTGEALHADPDRPNMGTTLTIALVVGDTMAIGQVGDSRAYLFRDGALTRLTEDQTIAAEQARSGLITWEAAERHPLRNVLTQAIGTTEKVDPETRTLSVSPGDQVMLCSDGVYGILHDGEMAAIIGESGGLEEVVEGLVRAAIAAGSSDNLTALLVRFTAED